MDPLGRMPTPITTNGDRKGVFKDGTCLCSVLLFLNTVVMGSTEKENIRVHLIIPVKHSVRFPHKNRILAPYTVKWLDEE